MGKYFKNLGYYWATPKTEGVRKWCESIPCIVMVTRDSNKVYTVGSGHFFYKSEFDYGDNPKPIMLPETILEYEDKIKALQSDVRRLEAVLEDESMRGDSHVVASDAYYEIASILKVAEGGSVIDTANTLMRLLKENNISI